MAKNRTGNRPDQAVDILERGNIYFFYRPQVQEESAQGLSDVQRFQFVLGPEDKERYRLITVGKKRLPEPEEHNKYWGFVDRAGSTGEQIRDALRGEKYQTATRGERALPAARPAGEGVYALARHGSHTHLVYMLELPKGVGEVQRALNIEEEGSYIISVKNPDVPSQAGLGGERKPGFPPQLRDRFKDQRWIAVDPPDFLDYEGAELLIIGAAEDVGGELDIRLSSEDESESTADVLNEFRLRKSEHPVEPLLKGKWE